MSYFDNFKIKFLDINGGDIPDSEYFGMAPDRKILFAPVLIHY